MATTQLKQVFMLDPTGEVAPTAKARAPRLAGIEGRTIGIISDGVAASTDLLRRLGELLQEQHGVARVNLVVKPHPSRPVPPSLLTELKESDAYVVGVGL